MFVVLLSAFFGIVGSGIAAAIIQTRTSWSANVGFPSMIGGILASCLLCVVVAAAPFTWEWMPVVAAALGLGFGAGGTFTARPLVYDYLERQKKTGPR